jgi:hypothetical protein
MAKCPMCGEVLEDAWVKKAGATLMGKSSSPGSKARSREAASSAARKRWKKERKREFIT